MTIQVIKEKIKETIFIGVVVGTLIAVGFICIYSINRMCEYVSANRAKTDIQQVIQEAGTYDALQNCETEDYRMVVLDRDAWEKDVRYYSKKYRHYLYYRVKPDLSAEEVPVTETAFLPDQYRGGMNMTTTYLVYTVFIQKQEFYKALKRNARLWADSRRQNILKTLHERVEELPVLLVKDKDLVCYREDPDVFIERRTSIPDGQKASYVQRDHVWDIIQKTETRGWVQKRLNYELVVLPFLSISPKAMEERMGSTTVKASYLDGSIIRKEFLCLYLLSCQTPSEKQNHSIG